MLPPVPGDVDAPAAPHLLVRQHVVQEPLHGGEAAGPAGETAVQAHRHHARRARTLGVQHVERIAQIGEELIARVEALRGREAHVVGVERVRHHQVGARPKLGPERQIIVVIVSVIKKSSLFHQQSAGVRPGASRIPAERALPGEIADDLDGALQVLALHRLRHLLVVDPAIAVAADFEPGGQGRFGHRRIALQRHRHREHGNRHLPLAEQLEQPPHADPAAILVDRLHAHVALAGQRPRADDLGQERLRGGVAVQHAVLAALLVVHHELHRQPRAVRPLCRRRSGAVALQVSGVVRFHRFLIRVLPPRDRARRGRPPMQPSVRVS